MHISLSTYAPHTTFGQPSLHTSRNKFRRLTAISTGLRSNVQASTNSRNRVQAKASPSPQDITEPSKVLIEVSPFLTLFVIPAVSGVFAGYIGVFVAELANLDEPQTVANGILFALCTVAFNFISANRQEIRKERRTDRKRSITVSVKDTRSVTMTVGVIMDACDGDFAKFSTALKLRLGIDDAQEVTVTAGVKSGAEVNIQDQIRADDSLSDFLREVEEVTVIQT